MKFDNVPFEAYVPPESKAADPHYNFIYGKVASEDDIKRCLRKMYGEWKIVGSKYWTSKAMSNYLRIGVAREGHPYRRDGFVKIGQVAEHVQDKMKRWGGKFTIQTILTEVAVNPKRRFEAWLSPQDEVTHIRAVQGHRQPMQINTDEFGWEEITYNNVIEKQTRLWHGTYPDALQSITQVGIMPRVGWLSLSHALQ